MLYINHDKRAEPIADHAQEEAIMKAYKLVASGTQNKQLNTPNILTFYTVESMCKDEKIPARNVVYMIDGVVQEMKYKIRGSSTVELPSSLTRDIQDLDYYSNILKNILGF